MAKVRKKKWARGSFGEIVAGAISGAWIVDQQNLYNYIVCDVRATAAPAAAAVAVYTFVGVISLDSSPRHI